jgi:hypothetical protein
MSCIHLRPAADGRDAAQTIGQRFWLTDSYSLSIGSALASIWFTDVKTTHGTDEVQELRPWTHQEALTSSKGRGPWRGSQGAEPPGRSPG